jgi:hypothetical protein
MVKCKALDKSAAAEKLDKLMKITKETNKVRIKSTPLFEIKSKALPYPECQERDYFSLQS